MATNMRFGRRLPLPSTRQIRRELLVVAAADETRANALATATVPAAVPETVPAAALPPE